VQSACLQHFCSCTFVCCRYDPGNAQLQADALELSAALNPDAVTTPASLKERADARFRAGDLEGAAEAYTALVQQVRQQQTDLTAAKRKEQQVQVDRERSEEQQQQQQQQECAVQLLPALSNRAACWLSLEQYGTCIEDCQAALALALAGQQGACNAAAAAAEASNTPSAAAAVPSGTLADAAAAASDSAESRVAAQSVLHQLQQQSPEQFLAAPTAGPARVRSVARLLSRLAVAHGCLKDTQHAVQLYGLAQRWWLAVGDEQRAAEMAADQQRLQQLLPATQAA
jgi:hypothetical protein